MVECPRTSSSPLLPSATGAPFASTISTSVPSSAGPIDGTSQPNIIRSRSSGESQGGTQQAKLVYSESPHPWTSGICARSANRRATSIESGAEETSRWRSAGTCDWLTPAASSIGSSVGTTLVTSTDSARMTRAQVNGSSRSVKTRCPPVESAVISPKPNACAW